MDELLKKLRAHGVKSATISDAGLLLSVDFFPAAPDAADFAPLALPTGAEPVDESRIPPALARILQRGSVS